jgi:hypothetical protein
MVIEHGISLRSQGPTRNCVSFFSPSFHDMIVGKYPSIQDCIREIKDPDVTNEAVGFHRNFALLRGPCQTLFLAYKDSPIGFLPNSDLSAIKLDRLSSHLREVVEELNIFANIA